MKRFSSRELRRMMKKMGIENIENLDLEYVEFKYVDGRVTRIYEPQASRIKIGDNYTYQIIGVEEEVEEEKTFPEEDIKLVMEQAGVDRELAIKALELTNGDIAEAIIALKEGGLAGEK